MVPKTENWVMDFTTTFDAAHHLLNLPQSHKCAQVHGHTWEVTVRFKGQSLDDKDMLFDFSLAKEVVLTYTGMLDHIDINRAFHDNISPTCEAISRWLYLKISADSRLVDVAKIDTVRVQETLGHGVTYFLTEIEKKEEEEKEDEASTT